MVAHLDEALTKLERMDKHELMVEIKRNFEVVHLDVLVSVEQNIVGVLVVTHFLLLSRNIDCNLNGLLHVSDSSIKLEGPCWLLRDVISLAHQVVNKLVCKRVNLDLADHIDHVGNSLLTLSDIELQGF